MELLFPAENLTQLKAAFAKGAGAVYLGVKDFCRWQECAVTLKQFEKLLNYSHSRGKKVYAALNRVPAAKQTAEFFKTLNQLLALKIDGVILNDPGIIGQVKTAFPELFIISSIGIAPLNLEELLFLQNLGADRIILPENTSPAELKKNKANSQVQLELFSSGFWDFTLTGKCYLSSYYRQEYQQGFPLWGSAKRGGCKKVCCFKFKLGGKNLRLAPRFFSLKTRLKDYRPYLSALKSGAGRLLSFQPCPEQEKNSL